MTVMAGWDLRLMSVILHFCSRRLELYYGTHSTSTSHEVLGHHVHREGRQEVQEEVVKG